jgi:hypothetical protein
MYVRPHVMASVFVEVVMREHDVSIVAHVCWQVTNSELHVAPTACSCASPLLRTVQLLHVVCTSSTQHMRLCASETMKKEKRPTGR